MSAEFYVTGGTLRPDAPCYVERRADGELYEKLRQGEFCYVLTPRQTGKSSLMLRTAWRLRQAGSRVAILDLTALGYNLDPERWYCGLLTLVGEQLDQEDELTEYWNANPQLGPLQRFMRALRMAALPGVQAGRCSGSHEEAAPPPQCPNTRIPEYPNLVVFIDEIDSVRRLPFSTDV